MHIRHGFVLQEHTRRTCTASNMCRARSNYKPFQGAHRSFSVVLGKDRFVFVSSHVGLEMCSPGEVQIWRLKCDVSQNYPADAIQFADTKCSILHLIPDMDMAYYTLIGRLTEMESKGSFKKGVAVSELKVFLP